MLAMVALLLVVLAATVVAVVLVVERNARAQLVKDLERARVVFVELQAYRHTLLRSSSGMVAEEPRLKAVVASDETSAETVQEVLAELRRSLGADVLVVTDESGRIIGDATDETATGRDLSGNDTVRAALVRGEAGGVWVADGAAHDVEARRLAFGATVVGALALGFRIDDRVAEALFKQTATSVAIELDGHLVSASRLSADRPLSAEDRAALERAVVSLKSGGGPVEVDVGGRRFLAQAAPLEGYQGKSTLRYAVLRSLDEALAPTRRLVAVILAIVLIATALSVGFAFQLSSALARPLAALSSFAGRIGGGDLKARATVSGPVEVQALATALNDMANELERNEHTTLSLIRYWADGRLVYAGAHEAILMARAATKRIERLPNPGTWLGAMRDISRFTVNTEARLSPGDVALLYTDGLTEAMNPDRRQLGIERVESLFAEYCEKPVEEIRDRLLEAVRRWAPKSDDDVTVVVMRYRG